MVVLGKEKSPLHKMNALSVWFSFPDFFRILCITPRGGEGYNIIEWTIAGDPRHFDFILAQVPSFLFFGAENLKLSKK